MMMKRLTCLLVLTAAVPVFAGKLIMTGQPQAVPPQSLAAQFPAVPQPQAPQLAAPTQQAAEPQAAAPQIFAQAAHQAAPRAAQVQSVRYEVFSSDRTIRDVLQRWSRATGWTHNQVHWTLLRDYPVQGAASAEVFGGDYKTAVRRLMSSTESTDLPAQPCFYTNAIVRVVAQAESCDRTVSSSQ